MSKTKKVSKSILVSLLFLFPLLLPSAFAEEPNRIIVNSENWVDVYSVMQYGVLMQKTTNFLVSDRHATLILNQIPKSEHIWAISSSSLPHVVGYQALLESKGYSSEEFEYNNINLEMAKTLTGVSDFIILDDSYGYNAISVAPYAAITRSYVLFADSSTIDDIVEFLSSRQVNSLLIYGQVDREVKAALEEYNPEVINEQGDRFLNNVEILKRYQEKAHSKQVILTNGEFIEQEIMAGSQPVVFIGTNNVPSAVRDYITQSDIEVGVLIGNELVGTATFVRRELGISVFVKFAQGARQPEGRISQVEALDMFYLPTYPLNLEIDSIKYNRATNQLEVTLRNTEDQAVYATGTYSLTDSENGRQTLGDSSPNFIDGNQLKTFVYDVAPMPEGRISVDAFIIYGESPGSLEKEIRLTMDVDSVRVIDSCEIRIDSATINLRSKQFVIDVESISDVDCYVDVELVDLIIAGEKASYSLEEVARLSPKDKKSLKVKVADFEPEDAEDNEEIKIRAYYGERETTLIKVLEGRFDLLIKKGDLLFYTLTVIIILLLLLIFWRRKKKKEEAANKA